MHQEFLGVQSLNDTVALVSQQGASPYNPQTTVAGMAATLPQGSYQVTNGILQTSIQSPITLEIVPANGGRSYFVGSTPIRK